MFCYLVFACDIFLYAQNLFVKKKEVNKQTQNCPDSLIYYTTDRWTDGQTDCGCTDAKTDESDFIRCCPTNVEHLKRISFPADQFSK